MEKYLCPLCLRPLDSVWDKHHLIPKSRKGTEVVDIHRICHDKIHSVFTEKELEDYYHTIPQLKESEHIQKFIRWVSKKDPNFYEKTKDTNRRKKKRKR